MSTASNRLFLPEIYEVPQEWKRKMEVEIYDPLHIYKNHNSHVHNKTFEMESEIHWLRIQCELKKEYFKIC